MAKYIIFNATDSVLATSQVFTSQKKAQDKIQELRTMFANYQGYYKTAQGDRISPEDITYHVIEQSTFNKHADYFYQ